METALVTRSLFLCATLVFVAMALATANGQPPLIATVGSPAMTKD